MNVPILITSRLVQALSMNNILPEQYGPAYSGESAGLDLYNASDETWVIGPNSGRVLIPTGLHIAVPVGHVALLFQRGSIVKTPLVHRAGVIDVAFSGEIFVNLAPLGDREHWINPNDKLPVQLVVVPCLNKFTSVTAEQYQEIVSQSLRGAGQVGSSDRV